MTLRDDNIDLHINVAFNEAQESIWKLNEVNRDLEKQTRPSGSKWKSLKPREKNIQSSLSNWELLTSQIQLPCVKIPNKGRN